jgi:toxin ParE1/3/4
MPLEVRQTPAARRDLLDIWEYAASASSADRSDKLLDSLFGSYQRIGEYPEIGRQRSALASGLRSYVAGSYVIFYAVSVDAVDIIRVVRAERDIDTLFAEDE